MQFRLFWLSLCLWKTGLRCMVQLVLQHPCNKSSLAHNRCQQGLKCTLNTLSSIQSSSWCVFCFKHYHNCFYVEHLCLVIQDNNVSSQRSLAPDYAMFGFPGIGHPKPTIHSPGVYLALFVHHLIPSCLNSSWTPSTHVLARDLFFDAFVKQHQMIPILTQPTSAFLLQCSVNTINTCSYLRLNLKLL